MAGTLKLDQVDPARAWQPWRPETGQRFDPRLAGHLYRRAAFGGTLDETRRAVKDGLDATVDRLLKGDAEAAAYEPLIAASGASIAQAGADANLRGWWLYAILNSGHPLREKMTLFWHNHFATSIAKVRTTSAMFAQNQVLRKHALGSFRPMLAEISRDPAMLVWLDSNRNVKGQPNENFARELLELFTLGVGNYTETDVREAAREFTGWHTDGEQYTFVPRLHDDGEKNVLGQRGPWNGTDIQRIVLSQPAAAQFLSRKLYRFFVNESAEPPASLLEPLAEKLRSSDFDIALIVRTILLSQHFYSELAYRRRIKSPVEYAIGVVRAVHPKAAPRELVGPLEAMGQSLFAPPNVKGWTGGRNWLNSATVLARQNFAQSMVGAPPPPAPLPTAPPGTDAPPKPAPAPTPESGPSTPPPTTAPAAPTPPPAAPATPAPVEPKPPAEPAAAVVVFAETTQPKVMPAMASPGFIEFVKRENPATPAATVDLLADLFLQNDIAPDERKKLLEFAASGNPKDADWDNRIREIAHALMTMAEYTLA